MDLSQMLEKINQDRNSPFIAIYNYINEGKLEEAITRIQNYFNCNEETAKEFLVGFRKRYYDTLKEECYSQLTPEEIARNNAEALDLFVNKPKCPTCGSTNIKKISDFTQLSDTFAFQGHYKQFRCKNCGYKW